MKLQSPDDVVLDGRGVKVGIVPAAMFGLCGTASAVFQFEALFIYNCDPSSMPVNAAKIVASATSLICLVFIYRIYWTNLLACRLWVLATYQDMQT